MRVLILSCNTGQGHNSASTALRAVFEKNGDLCDTMDSLSFISQRVSNLIGKGHTFIYRYLPWLFRWGYDYSEKKRGLFAPSSPVYRFLTRGADQLYRLCEEKKYDVVIAAHTFSVLILSEAKKNHPLKVRTYFLATDYTCRPGAEQSDLDGYFIPDATLTEEFAKYGISRERIVASGIPVRGDFFCNTPKEEAKRLVQIPEGHTHLLMMCGSMGCGPMKKLAKRLGERLSETEEMTVLCGTNQKLYRKLKKLFAKQKNIHIEGFSNRVSLLMDSADLYVTKPGGISVTEAAVKCLPMVFIDAVAGCEEYNMHYYIQRGGAVTAKGITELCRLCLALMKEKETREKLSAALRAIRPMDGAAFIDQYIGEKTT